MNKRWPWLKLALIICLPLFVILHNTEIFVFYGGDGDIFIPSAPMQKHPRVPNKVFRYSTDGKMLVALTFDDGPSEATTPRLLDVLWEKNAVATFFELGSKMRNNPDIAKRAVEEGHEVESHTMYHQNMITLSSGAIEADISEAKQVYRDVLGTEVKLFRMPYGNSNGRVAAIVNTPLIYWTVDTRDWAVLNADLVRDNAINGSFDGAIILMHDIYDSTVDAVAGIIDGLRDAGYEFVTVSELAKNRGIDLINDEVYYSFRSAD